MISLLLLLNIFAIYAILVVLGVAVKMACEKARPNDPR
jgi:hypothetical protein